MAHSRNWKLGGIVLCLFGIAFPFAVDLLPVDLFLAGSASAIGFREVPRTFFEWSWLAVFDWAAAIGGVLVLMGTAAVIRGHRLRRNAVNQSRHRN